LGLSSTGCNNANKMNSKEINQALKEQLSQYENESRIAAKNEAQLAQIQHYVELVKFGSEEILSAFPQYGGGFASAFNNSVAAIGYAILKNDREAYNSAMSVPMDLFSAGLGYAKFLNGANKIYKFKTTVTHYLNGIVKNKLIDISYEIIIK
jgi:hypothetical protein